jgi:hypothetical protein
MCQYFAVGLALALAALPSLEEGRPALFGGASVSGGQAHVQHLEEGKPAFSSIHGVLLAEEKDLES